jgi:hypothetical protein
VIYLVLEPLNKSRIDSLGMVQQDFWDCAQLNSHLLRSSL